jgi:hypothetical protein
VPDEQTLSPTADAQAGAAVAQPPQPASDASSPFNHREAWSLSKAFEGSTIPVGEDDDTPAVSSGSESESAAPAKAEAQDAKSAKDTSSEGAKASDAPESGEGSDSSGDPDTPLSRREQERLKHEQKIADLEAKVKSFEAPDYRETLRAEILAEEAQKATSSQTAQQARADAERFEQACRMGDNDARLSEIVPGTNLTLYAWREEQKDLRDKYPEAERALRADAERYAGQVAAAERERAEREIAAGWDRIKSDMGDQIAASANLHGVDKEAFKAPGVTWKDMAEQIHAAGAAWKEAELAGRVEKAEAEAASLRQQLKDGNSEGLGSRRAPPVAGRSAGAAPNGKGFDPDTNWRGNLAAAFDWNTNGPS